MKIVHASKYFLEWIKDKSKPLDETREEKRGGLLCEARGRLYDNWFFAGVECIDKDGHLSGSFYGLLKIDGFGKINCQGCIKVLKENGF